MRKLTLPPHQVDAALFTFSSPLSKGVLLADEVGLGKTIEARLVPSQKIAEGKRHILVITPANLRKQWYQSVNRDDPFEIMHIPGHLRAAFTGKPHERGVSFLSQALAAVAIHKLAAYDRCKTIYSLVALTDIAVLYQECPKALVGANITGQMPAKPAACIR